MTVRDENCTVTLRQDGKIDLKSSWSSTMTDGEFARVEITLPEDGPFRFQIAGALVTVFPLGRRKVTTNVAFDDVAEYVNLQPADNPRLARFIFRAIWKRTDGTETDRKVERKKFLP